MVQVPVQGNFSVMQQAEIVNCAPIVHTMPPVQNNGYVQNIDPSTSLYIISQAPLTIQIPNESTMHPAAAVSAATAIEVPMETNVTNMVSEFKIRLIFFGIFLSKQTNKNRVTI